jgi:hypothetical protein
MKAHVAASAISDVLRLGNDRHAVGERRELPRRSKPNHHHYL